MIVNDTMLTVMLCDEDNDSVAFASILHIFRRNDSCDAKTFKEHWDKALQQVKDQNPEEWILEDVYELMEEQGWIILRPKHIEVDY